MFSSFRSVSRTSHSSIGIIWKKNFSRNESVISDHFCVAITSWFCCPDLGMDSYKSLMKSSAFLVKANLGANGPQYHLVTSSHNIAPWKFPKYYPEPFMKYINEDHVHFTIEIRMSNGEMISACDLTPVSFHHETKDIAVLHLLDETAALNGFKQLGFKMLDIEDYRAAENENLTFYGHEVFEGGQHEGEDISLSAPRTIKGSLVFRSEHQTFCSTPGVVLSPGMCGGPVVGKRGSICGMIDGIVPIDHTIPEMRGCPVITEAPDILRFIKNVEDFPEKVHRMTGSKISHDHVGSQALKNPEDYKDPMNFLAKHL